MNTSVNDADISFSDLGDTVSTAGDVDGDGLPEVLIGAVSDDYSYPDAGQVFLFSPYAATPPSGVGSIALYSDDHYLTEAVDAHILDTIYVEATGTDTNSSRKDSMEVMVNSTSTAPIPIRITLYETDKNTGVYRGEFRIGYWSDKGRATIGAGEGERVWAWPRMDPSLEANLTILPAFPTIHPTDDIFIAHEDEAFSQGFYIEDSISTWDVKTGSDWLKWDDKNRTLLGIPDNADVGPHHVNMTARDRFGALDSENITIQVINRPPTILTNDTRNATQSIGYLVNYTCDDDGQGNITWHLLTNASFLSMNISTGVLSGVPGNDDVGTRFANVTVEDGNGGLDWSNFTLIVHNVNDGPIITTKDVLTINEDEELSVEYNARDVDENDVLEWRFETDATWLSFNQSTHVLSGMPRNDDVGRYYVNISVKDASNATDIHNFTLEVLNVPPKILTLDVLEVLEDQAYSVNYTCDDDGQGTVAWHMATNASWLSMNGTTGVLAGTPENDDVGSWWVNVSVDDGNGGFDWSNFSLRVINSNDIPIIITILILEATVDMLYIYDVNATDIDMGDVLRYILVTSPDGMTIDKDTGVIIWIPMQGQEGAQNVILEVTDSIASARQNFTINVYAHLIADITYPGPGEKVHGTIIVTGTATGPMGIWVEVNIDDTGWKRAIGSSSWTCEMDTEELDNGEHRIVARVILNEQSSDEVSVSFVVDNQEGGDILLKEGAVLWVIISFIIILLLFVIGSFIWRKNTLQMIDEADQDEEEEEEEEDEEEEDEEADEDEDEEEDDEEEEEEDDEEDEEKENEDDKDEEEEEDLPKKPKRRND